MNALIPIYNCKDCPFCDYEVNFDTMGDFVLHTSYCTKTNVVLARNQMPDRVIPIPDLCPYKEEEQK